MHRADRDRKMNKMMITVTVLIIIMVIDFVWFTVQLSETLDFSDGLGIRGERGLSMVAFGAIIVIMFALVVIASNIILFQKKQRESFWKLAYIDEVTGGYTFIRFRDEAEQIVRKNDIKSAIISLDIDGFKLINNLYGYDEGNNLIRLVCNKIEENLNILYQEELVAHQEADKFVVLMHYFDRDELESRFESICSELKGTYMDSKRYLIHPVVGIYEVTDNSEDIRLMVDYATIARKSIKGTAGENFLSYYDERIKNKLVSDRKIESMMEDAIRKHEFCVFYQPKYSTIDNTVVGAEALVRWKKADGSFILPGDFLPLFESNGFITTLDQYMFNEVCRSQRRWFEEGLNPVPVSVNLSRVHLYNKGFIGDYKEIINQTGVSANLMQLEITESAIYENRDVLADVIDQLHDCGITVLMDDFGTGYSTMMMLKDINVDVMKLDKTFVDDIGNERGEKIIHAIIKLAQSLDMEVTAEGVESKEQYEFLKNAACDNIQGYYFSKPIPEDDYERLLKKRK